MNETQAEKKLFDEIDKLYPWNERGWSPSLERDVEKIREFGKGSSSFNKTMIRAADIEYIWALETYINETKEEGEL